VACPIVRQFHGSGTWIRAAVLQGSGTAWRTTSCTLRATSYDGGSHWVAQSPSVSVSGDSTQMYWSGLVGDSYGAYAITCTVPAGATIYRYWVHEGAYQGG
jgi:hypothetical protein